MWLVKKFSDKEVFRCFLILSFAYVFPIVHADYLYIDDQWRSLLLVDKDWQYLGRFFAQLLYNVLTFTASMPNIFPLPLLLSVLALSWAMKRLVFQWYAEVDFAKCLVVLPLLTSPFFLGNLTYQYDGPAMVFAVVAIVLAITLRIENSYVKTGVAAVLIALALGLYQLTISIFVGLSCFEAVFIDREKMSWGDFWHTARSRLFELASGMAIYFFTAYSIIDSERAKLLAFDKNWLAVIENRLELVFANISLLNANSLIWVWVPLLFLASAGISFFIRKCLANERRTLGKLAILLIVSLALIVLVVCIPGAMLFVAENRMDARDLTGFAVLAILVFYWAHATLAKLHERAGLLLVIPCFYMFSLAYMYGQVLIAKKEYEANLSSNIAYDLTSRAELKDISDFSFSVPKDTESIYWIPAAEKTIALTPVLKYLLSDNNVMLWPDRFQRLGVNRVFWAKEDVKKLITENRGELVVNNKQYLIYRVGRQGFIEIKSPKLLTMPRDTANF